MMANADSRLIQVQGVSEAEKLGLKFLTYITASSPQGSGNATWVYYNMGKLQELEARKDCGKTVF